MTSRRGALRLRFTRPPDDPSPPGDGGLHEVLGSAGREPGERYGRAAAMVRPISRAGTAPGAFSVALTLSPGTRCARRLVDQLAGKVEVAARHRVSDPLR